MSGLVGVDGKPLQKTEPVTPELLEKNHEKMVKWNDHLKSIIPANQVRMHFESQDDVEN
ncbi:hypothetical protein ACKGJO_06685 [Gracilimonas sp. Q87]|uniref:hypothetical protein n=1 Tax=Gracilimonas sp. Q87 TaxID=3384766 RepID=UPI003983EF03